MTEATLNSPVVLLILTTLFGGIGWLIRRTAKRAEDKSDAQLEATTANTQALKTQIGGLTDAVNQMTTQNAVIVKTLEFVNEKQIDAHTERTTLFQKTDALEKGLSELTGICKARHELGDRK